MPSSAYIHIPFCRRRCFYCDFPVAIVGDKPPVAQSRSSTATTSELNAASQLNGSSFGTIARYVDALCQEIRLTPAVGTALKTVFLGGGTPSLLMVEQLNRILAALDHQFGISSDAEISIEIDPGTFDLAQLQGYLAAGVNRVSLGVQAFQPELLKACGRSHTIDDVYTAIETIRGTGLTNFSLDLISGLPKQTLEHWQASLEQAIALQPTHLSCYDLTVEPMTAFGRQYKPGVSPLPSDDLTADMYRLAAQLLTAAGYEHYEISNYAKLGYQCRHNRVYWENRPFYGFGMGATSYIEGNRFARPRKTREYYEWVEERIKGQGERIQGESSDSVKELQSAELLLDTLMLGLRLADGLSLVVLSEQFGRESLERVLQCLHHYYQKGWVEVTSKRRSEAEWDVTALLDSGRLRLTDPEGFLFSNVMLVDLFEAFE